MKKIKPWNYKIEPNTLRERRTVCVRTKIRPCRSIEPSWINKLIWMEKSAAEKRVVEWVVGTRSRCPHWPGAFSSLTHDTETTRSVW
jgi:hypothetical protein